jgi:hypothetical protein
LFGIREAQNSEDSDEELKKETFGRPIKKEAEKATISLMTTRTCRVPSQQDEFKPRVEIQARLPSKNLIQRKFSPNEGMSAAYDWLGSIVDVPLHFSLYVPATGNVLSPSELVTVVDDAVIHFKKEDESVILSTDDKEVAFKGFGPFNQISADDTTAEVSQEESTYRYDQIAMFSDFSSCISN